MENCLKLIINQKTDQIIINNSNQPEEQKKLINTMGKNWVNFNIYLLYELKDDEYLGEISIRKEELMKDKEQIFFDGNEQVMKKFNKIINNEIFKLKYSNYLRQLKKSKDFKDKEIDSNFIEINKSIQEIKLIEKKFSFHSKINKEFFQEIAIQMFNFLGKK